MDDAKTPRNMYLDTVLPLPSPPHAGAQSTSAANAARPIDYPDRESSWDLITMVWRAARHS